MSCASKVDREEAMRLIEQFKATICTVNAPDENGQAKVAGAEWTDRYFSAVDSLKDIGL